MITVADGIVVGMYLFLFHAKAKLRGRFLTINWIIYIFFICKSYVNSGVRMSARATADICIRTGTSLGG